MPVSLRRRGACHALAVVAVFTAAGCGVSTAPLAVQVRDVQTRQPLAAAFIVADSLALGPSLNPGDIIDDLRGRRAPFTSRAQTDAQGVALLEFAPGRSVRLGVLGQGLAPSFMLLDQDVATHTTEWLAIPTEPGGDHPALELRAGPPASLTSR